MLNGGCVQEEIRFAIEPELVCACLLFEALDDNEAITVWGTERYSSYKGYMFNLRYGGDTGDVRRMCLKRAERLDRV